MASLLLAARSHPAFTDFYLQNEGHAPNQNGLETGKPDLQSVFKKSGGGTELGRWMAGVSLMALQKRGENHYGDSQADIRAEIARYSKRNACGAH